MTNIELYGVEDSVENRGGRTAGRIFAGQRRLFDYKDVMDLFQEMRDHRDCEKRIQTLEIDLQKPVE